MEITKPITFDGYEGAFLACPRIHIWKDWGDRSQGIAGSVDHGSPGVLLERRGQRCKIQTSDGTVGFVTFYFLREEKVAWQAEQLLLESAKGYDD